MISLSVVSVNHYIFPTLHFHGGLEKCNGFLVFFTLCVSSLSNPLLRLEEGKQMTQSRVEVVEINSQPVVCRGSSVWTS